MAQLPTPGGDDGTWGDILNGFLLVAHNADGSLSSTAVSDALPGPIPAAKLGSGTASSSNFLRGDGVWAVPNGGSSALAQDTDVALSTPQNNQVLMYDGSTGKWSNESLPGASTSAAGLIQIDGTAGDIQADTTAGAAVAGSTGKAADAGHQHPLASHDHSSANKGGNIPESSVTNLTADLAAKAPIASPALTGVPTAPTATAGTNSTQIATTAYADGAAGSAQANAKAYALPAAGGTMAGWLAPKVVTLTDSSSVSINAAGGNVFRWPLGGSGHTLAAPGSPADGQILILRIVYSGAYTPLFNAAYDFTAIAAPAWTAASGKVDEAGFRYNADANSGSGAWVFIGALLGV